MSQSIASAYRYLTSRGYSPAAASGILGNLVQESGRGLNTRAVHDNGTGFGIAGWRDPRPGEGRRTALFNFAAARGGDPGQLDTQLAFLDHELRTSEAGVGRQLASAQTPQDAARAFISFERPAGWTRANPEAGHGFGNRRDNAAQIYAQMTGQAAPMSAPTGPGGPARGVQTTAVAPDQAPTGPVAGNPAVFADMLAQQGTANAVTTALQTQQNQIAQREKDAQARRAALFGGVAGLYGG